MMRKEDQGCCETEYNYSRIYTLKANIKQSSVLNYLYNKLEYFHWRYFICILTFGDIIRILLHQWLEKQQFIVDKCTILQLM